MAFGELGRVALQVDDIHAVVADLHKVFGMEIEIHDRAVPSMGLRAAVGQDGIELFQPVGDQAEAVDSGSRPLGAIVIAVDDLQEAFERLEAAGFKAEMSVVTDTGLRELSYGSSFHGIPLALYQKDEEELLTTPATGIPFDLVQDPTEAPPLRVAAA
jgi:hypothetical protein